MFASFISCSRSIHFKGISKALKYLEQTVEINLTLKICLTLKFVLKEPFLNILNLLFTLVIRNSCFFGLGFFIKQFTSHRHQTHH